MADIEQSQQMIPLSRLKFPLVKMSASWCLVSMYFDLDFRVQNTSIEQPIKSNSVSSGDVSHCRTSPFQNHFNYNFIVLKHTQKNFLVRGLDI